MPQALLSANRQAIATDQVARIIQARATGEPGSAALMKALDLTHKPTFRANYLDPAREGGWIERTQPDTPRSPTQRYRLSEKGRRRMARGMTSERS
jgi:hypothetical protein